MADPTPHAETEDDTGMESDQGAATGKRRWLSVLAIVIAVALVLLFVLLHLTGTLGPGTNG